MASFYLSLGFSFFQSPCISVEPEQCLSFSVQDFCSIFSFTPTLDFILFFWWFTMFVQMGKQGERIRPLLFQLIAQILISSLWYFPLSMKFDDATNYLKLRFLTDQIISMLVLVPLCLWFHNFVQIILQKATVIDDGKERIA